MRPFPRMPQQPTDRDLIEWVDQLEAWATYAAATDRDRFTVGLTIDIVRRYLAKQRRTLSDRVAEIMDLENELSAAH